MTVKVTGLDLSMTATGVAHNDLDMTGCTHLIKPRERGDLRLAEIVRAVKEYAADSDLVLIEDLPVNAKMAGITGQVQGVVRLALIEMGIKYATLTPANLKKYATGRGNASKTDMAIAALKRGDREFGDDNQCDAFWLWAAGMDYLGEPVVQLPQDQRAELGKLKMEV